MLNALRSSGSNIFVWIVILLLIVGLAGFGVSMSGSGTATTAVASVGEKDVTVDEYVRAINLENRRLSQQIGRQFSINEMQTFGLDQQVLSQLLNSAAIDNEAQKLGISVGDETIRDALLSNRAFSGADGKFDQQAYEFALQNANLTPAQYDQILRDEATREIFRLGLVRGVEVPETAALETLKFLGERRTIDWVRLNATHLEIPVGAPTDDELSAFYDENIADYTTPETREITYASITEDELIDEVEVTEASIREIYEERAAEYSSPARRILDRIVFGNEEDAKKAVEDINLGSKSFASVANDRGLAVEDYELGEVTANELDKEARDLLFGTEELGIYGPVNTLLGPAVFRVNAVLDATQITLEEAREELRSELARAEAGNRIAEATDSIDDLIAGGATLEEVADETMLNLGTISFNSDSDGGIVADEAFRIEALDAGVGEDRDLFDLSDGIAVLRVNEIIDPTPQPLDTVRADVEDAWRAQETTSRLSDLAASLKERIDGGESLAEISGELGMVLIEESPLGRNDIVEDTPPQFVQEIFSVDNGGAAIVPDTGSVLMAVVTDIIPAVLIGEESDAQLAQLEEEITFGTSRDLFVYYTQGLQEESGISVNQSLIGNVLSQLANPGAQQGY